MKKKFFSFDEKIFLAGVNGMVGSAIFRKLKSSGYGNKKKGGIIYSPSSKELNLLNYQDVDDWFKVYKPTIVIIAAAKVGGIFANYSNPTEFILNNLKIQTNTIEIAWKHKVKRLLFLGSSCIYPKFAKQPIKEDYLLEGALEPTNQWYAVAKIAGLKLCQALRIEHGFDAISLMPTNLYGPRDNYHPKNSHVMAALIKKFSDASYENLPNVQCWGSGTPLREFMHVDDLADACLYVLENWDPNNEYSPRYKNGEKLYFLNVGTGQEISIKELANKIAKYSDFQGKIIWDSSKPNGTPRKLLDVSKINKLGWKSNIKLDEGIKMTIKSYKGENFKT